jgi:hypothetical protein
MARRVAISSAARRTAGRCRGRAVTATGLRRESGERAAAGGRGFAKWGKEEADAEEGITRDGGHTKAAAVVKWKLGTGALRWLGCCARDTGARRSFFLFSF